MKNAYSECQGGVQRLTTGKCGNCSGWPSFDSEVRRLAEENLRLHFHPDFANIRLPKTLISDKIALVEEFLTENKKVVVKFPQLNLKPVFADRFTLQQLSVALRDNPLLFQEYIPGTTVRTYIWGTSIIHADIGNSFDPANGSFRETTTFVNVPTGQEKFSMHLCQCLKVDCGLLEWRRNQQGFFYFLKLKFRQGMQSY